eukprot:COSAG02_NODE_1863_length_10608_cov_128.518508_6_plen_241_part_00
MLFPNSTGKLRPISPNNSPIVAQFWRTATWRRRIFVPRPGRVDAAVRRACSACVAHQQPRSAPCRHLVGFSEKGSDPHGGATQCTCMMQTVVVGLLSPFHFVVCHRTRGVRRLAPRRCRFRQREVAWTYASRLVVRTPSIYTLTHSLLETQTTLSGAQESVGGPKWGGNRTSVETAMLASGGDPQTYTGSGTEPCRITLRKWCVTPCAIQPPLPSLALGCVRTLAHFGLLASLSASAANL